MNHQIFSLNYKRLYLWMSLKVVMSFWNYQWGDFKEICIDSYFFSLLRPFLAQSCRTELGGGQRKATTNDWKVLLFVIMFIMLYPAPFFFFHPALLRAWPQTLTVKEIGAPPPPPPPSPPPPPPLPHSVSLCFTNWSHSESTGRKTKRDILPFF